MRKCAWTGWSVLVVLLVVPVATAGDGVNKEQQRLIVEGWRRLVHERYDSHAAAESAWRPIVKAFQVSLSQRRIWGEPDKQLQERLTASLQVAITPGRTQHRQQSLKVQDVHRVNGKGETLLIRLVGQCRVGDVSDGKTRAPRADVLFWWEGKRLRHQRLYEFVVPKGWWFYGGSERVGTYLAFSGHLYAGGNWTRPALLLYRKRGVRWQLVQRVAWEHEGKAGFEEPQGGSPLPKVAVSWQREEGKALWVPHAGPHLYFDERWTFQRGRYRRVSVAQRHNPFAALDSFVAALRREDRRTARKYARDAAVIETAVKLGLADPQTQWTVTDDEPGEDESELELHDGERRVRVQLEKANRRWRVVKLAADVKQQEP